MIANVAKKRGVFSEKNQWDIKDIKKKKTKEYLV